MRISIVLLVLLAGLAGCGNTPPAPSPTTPDGTWSYKTPDNSISVDFELKTMGGTLAIVNPAIAVSGTSGEAAGQLTDVALPAIGMIRINANDAGLIQPYSITFNMCSVSTDFKSISVVDVEYTYPWGTIKTLTNIVIRRK